MNSRVSRSNPAIAVIGSGPCGAMAAFLLLSKGFQVDMFDLGVEENDSFAKISHLGEDEGTKYKVSKDLKGSKHHYDLNTFNVLNSESHVKNWYTSQSRGGFSNVWGATWEKHIKISDESWDTAYKTVDLILSNSLNHEKDSNKEFRQDAICSCFSDIYSETMKFDHLSHHEKWQIPNLAISPSRCSFLGECVNLCRNNAIWNSTFLLDQCSEFSSYRYIPKHFLQSFENEGSNVVLNFYQVDLQRVIRINYETCVLALGPVANSMVLMRSRVCDEVTLRDTRIIKTLFLGLKKKPNHPGAFSLSGLSVTDYATDNDSVLSHTQFYSHLEEFEDRIKNRYAIFKVKIAFKALILFRTRLFLALVYLSERDSDRIKLCRQESEILVQVDQNSSQWITLIKTYLRFLKRSWRVGLLPIPYFDIGTPGDSYHVGNPLERKKLLTGISELAKHPGVHIAGAWSLPFLPPGGITRSAMAQTYLLVDRIISSRLSDLD